MQNFSIDLVTLQDAANILKCHPNTSRNWDKEGVLTSIRVGKRRLRRYIKDDILKLLSHVKVSNFASSQFDKK